MHSWLALTSRVLALELCTPLCGAPGLEWPNLVRGIKPGGFSTVTDLTVTSGLALQVAAWKECSGQREHTPVFLPGESQGRGSLGAAIYGDRTELDGAGRARATRGPRGAAR